MKTSVQREWRGSKQKYGNPDYGDEAVKSLMKDFGMTDYVEFMRKTGKASA
jgi:hypothetical protein